MYFDEDKDAEQSESERLWWSDEDSSFIITDRTDTGIRHGELGPLSAGAAAGVGGVG